MSKYFYYPNKNKTTIGTSKPNKAIFHPVFLKLFLPAGINRPVIAIRIKETAKPSEYNTQKSLVNLCKNLV